MGAVIRILTPEVAPICASQEIAAVKKAEEEAMAVAL